MNELRLCLLNTIHLKYIVGVSETMLSSVYFIAFLLMNYSVRYQ